MKKTWNGWECTKENTWNLLKETQRRVIKTKGKQFKKRI